jgi:hypothetical protein
MAAHVPECAEVGGVMQEKKGDRKVAFSIVAWQVLNQFCAR